MRKATWAGLLRVAARAVVIIGAAASCSAQHGPGQPAASGAPAATGTGSARAGPSATGSPLPPAPVTGRLIGVSCSGATCMAVGSYGKVSVGTPTAQPVMPLAERWDGTRWQAQRPPLPPGAAARAGTPQDSLTIVSCGSASACMAIGSYTTGTGKLPLAESWDGTSWAAQPVPGPAGAAATQLAYLSCASASACTAVGSYTRLPGVTTPGGPGSLPLAETWNGTTWTAHPLPGPARTSGSFLTAVACTSPATCVAVGASVDDSNPAKPSEQALSVSWDGTRWTARDVPKPAGATSTILTALSCPSPASCTAIGYVAIGTGVRPLIESWNGTSWTARPSPRPLGRSVGFATISCTSAISCMAVGNYTTKTSTLAAAESWDGTAWAIRSPLNPAGANTTSLIGISCTQASACMAVGSTIPSKTVALAQWWDGTTWAYKPVPLP